MSDTDDTEGYSSINKSICSDKKITFEKNMEKNELIKIDILEIISDLFNNICEENKDKKNNENPLIKPFINKTIPSITIKDYLFRLIKYSQINTSTIIMILIYIDKICNSNHFLLTYYNIHKLILASLVMAIKYNEDQYYSMEFYSKLGGVTVEKLKIMESTFLLLIQYNLFIKDIVYEQYYNNLMN